MSKINKQISHLAEERTSESKEKVGTADRAKLFYILIAEADNFTRHLQPRLRHAWKYAPGAAADVMVARPTGRDPDLEMRRPKSVIGGKADNAGTSPACPLMTQSGHRQGLSRVGD
jgi:hypothetical protein